MDNLYKKKYLKYKKKYLIAKKIFGGKNVSEQDIAFKKGETAATNPRCSDEDKCMAGIYVWEMQDEFRMGYKKIKYCQGFISGYEKQKEWVSELKYEPNNSFTEKSQELWNKHLTLEKSQELWNKHLTLKERDEKWTLWPPAEDWWAKGYNDAYGKWAATNGVKGKNYYEDEGEVAVKFFKVGDSNYMWRWKPPKWLPKIKINNKKIEYMAKKIQYIAFKHEIDKLVEEVNKNKENITDIWWNNYEQEEWSYDGDPEKTLLLTDYNKNAEENKVALKNAENELEEQLFGSYLLNTLKDQQRLGKTFVADQVDLKIKDQLELNKSDEEKVWYIQLKGNILEKVLDEEGVGIE